MPAMVTTTPSFLAGGYPQEIEQAVQAAQAAQLIPVASARPIALPPSFTATPGGDGFVITGSSSLGTLGLPVPPSEPKTLIGIPLLSDEPRGAGDKTKVIWGSAGSPDSTDSLPRRGETPTQPGLSLPYGRPRARFGGYSLSGPDT